MSSCAFIRFLDFVFIDIRELNPNSYKYVVAYETEYSVHFRLFFGIFFCYLVPNIKTPANFCFKIPNKKPYLKTNQ